MGKDLELAARDQRIMQKAAAGIPYAQIAEQEGISKARVGQIVLAHSTVDISSDEKRAYAETILDTIIMNLLPDVTGPGRRIMTPKGPAYEQYEDFDGKIVNDFDKPIFDHHANREPAETIIKALDRKAKMFSLDPWRATDNSDNSQVEALIDWAQQTATESKVNLVRIAELEAKLAKYEQHAIEPVEAEIVDPSEPTHQEYP